MKNLVKFLWLGIVKAVLLTLVTLILSVIFIVPAIAAYQWSWFILFWYLVPIIFLGNKFNGFISLALGWWKYYRIKQQMKIIGGIKL